MKEAIQKQPMSKAKKRNLIILGTIGGIGVLATAITLPIVLTKNKSTTTKPVTMDAYTMKLNDMYGKYKSLTTSSWSQDKIVSGGEKSSTIAMDLENDRVIIGGNKGKLSINKIDGTHIAEKEIFGGGSSRVISSIKIPGTDNFLIGGTTTHHDAAILKVDKNGNPAQNWTLDGRNIWFGGQINGFLELSNQRIAAFGFGGNSQGDLISIQVFDFEGNESGTPVKIDMSFVAESMSSDGRGGYFIGGRQGQLYHLDSNLQHPEKVNLSATNFRKSTIRQIVVEEKENKVLLAGDTPTIVEIDSLNKIYSGHQKNIDLAEPITPAGLFLDNEGGYILVGGHRAAQQGGSEGTIAHFNWDGQTAKHTIETANWIYGIIKDGQGQFFIVEANGHWSHIDLNGTPTLPETKEQTIARWKSHGTFA